MQQERKGEIIDFNYEKEKAYVLIFFQQKQAFDQIFQITSVYGDHFEYRHKENQTGNVYHVPNLNKATIQNLQNILFVSDTLLNVRAIQGSNITSQKLWKAIDVTINRKGDASFILWNTGLEYLKLMPKAKRFQIGNQKVGTFKIFYYFQAAYNNPSQIENSKLRNQFQTIYNLNEISEYKILGQRKFKSNQDIEQFNKFCRILMKFKVDVIAFFDLIAVCIVKGGMKSEEKDKEEEFDLIDDFNQSESFSQGSTGTTGLYSNQEIEQFLSSIIQNEWIEYTAIDVYQQILDNIRAAIETLNSTNESFACVQIIEKGEYVTNFGNFDLLFSDFAMNYCKDVFELTFQVQQDAHIKEKVQIISKFFDECYQNNTYERIDPRSLIQSLQQFTQPNQANQVNWVSLLHKDNEYLKYDLSCLKNQQSVYRKKVLEMFRKQETNIILKTCSENVFMISILKFIEQRLGRINDSKFKYRSIVMLPFSTQQGISSLNENEDSIEYKSDNTRISSNSLDSQKKQMDLIEEGSNGPQSSDSSNQQNNQESQYNQTINSIVQTGTLEVQNSVSYSSENNSTDSD